MSNYKTLLKNRNFVLYSVGQAFSQFGDRLVQIVLIGFVYKRWPGSSIQLAKILFFTVIPSFFISPIAGVYIDRWDKKYVMIASDMFRAAAILLIPLFFLFCESPVPIYTIIFLNFAAACFFLPAKLSIIPKLVPKNEILIANSASSITWVVSGIVGFSLGGILVEWIGIRKSFFANSAVYLLSSASFLMLIHSVRNRPYSGEPGKADGPEKRLFRKSVFQEFIEGLKALFSDRRLKFVAYIFFVLSSLIGAIYVVGVVFVQETLGSMTRAVGVLGMCLFAGLLLGSSIYGKVGNRLPRVKTIFMSLFLSGIFVVIFAVGLRLTKSFLFGSAAAFILGLFVSPIYVGGTTIIHESTESNLRARIFSSIGIIMNLGFLLFMFISAILAGYMDKMWILVACGTGFSLFGIISMSAGFLKEFTSSSGAS